LGWTIIGPSAHRRAACRVAGEECRPAWHPPREAEVDSGGWLGGVEAGHSEAWASKPADLARHWLGETEDAPEELLQSEPADLARHWLGETEDVLKELLRTVQEPEEEAG